MVQKNPKFNLSFWHPASLVSTFFGVGRMPFAPGTFGSIAAFPVFFLIMAFAVIPVAKLIGKILKPLALHSTQAALEISSFCIIWALLLCIGTWFSSLYAQKTNKLDPKEVVIDEVVGQLLTIYCVVPPGMVVMAAHPSKSHGAIEIILLLIGSFLAFRFYDILKPWPIRWFDQNVKGGIGIMLDDVMAGIMAAVTCNAILLVIYQ